MKKISILAHIAATTTFLIASAPFEAAGVDDEDAPIRGFEIPAGYRDWKLISVAHEEGAINDIRAILGNDVAVDAARNGRLPFPDGAIVARLAWSYDALPESAEAFGKPQSFVAGTPKNGVQFMVKDAKKYASTGGWGYIQFNAGKPGGEPAHVCFACHKIAQSRDFVFNHYVP